jgi:hypothetical protein
MKTLCIKAGEFPFAVTLTIVEEPPQSYLMEFNFRFSNLKVRAFANPEEVPEDFIKDTMAGKFFGLLMLLVRSIESMPEDWPPERLGSLMHDMATYIQETLGEPKRDFQRKRL